MSQVRFEVESDLVISDHQMAKIIAGTQLLGRVISDPQFERWVLNFQWQTNDGQLFRQFYYSCGRSNRNVLKSLYTAQPWDSLSDDLSDDVPSIDRVIKVYPCERVEDYAQVQLSDDVIGLDLRYVNKHDYTPIHIAAALCQEYCIHLGYPPSGKALEECWSKFTVPVAMARILRDVVVILAQEDEELLEWCMQNADFQFDYQPCSFTFGIQKIGHDIFSNFNHLTKTESTSQETHGNNNILTSLPN